MGGERAAGVVGVQVAAQVGQPPALGEDRGGQLGASVVVVHRYRYIVLDTGE